MWFISKSIRWELLHNADGNTNSETTEKHGFVKSYYNANKNPIITTFSLQKIPF